MKLSIITVNLNNRDGLKKTLDSVASQTWRDFEHIIIDGASTDGSVDVIKEYAESHANSVQPSTINHQPSSIIWKSEPDTGIFNAMNKGILMAQGEYCYFLNSGDWIVYPDSLERSMDEIKDADIVTHAMLVDFEGKMELRKQKSNYSLRDLVFSTIPHSAVTYIRRSLFEKYGLYDESLKIGSDWKFFLQAVGLSDATVHTSDVVLGVFDTTGISCVNVELNRHERTIVLEDLIPLRTLEDYKYLADLENQLVDSKRQIQYCRSAKGVAQLNWMQICKAVYLKLFHKA